MQLRTLIVGIALGAAAALVTSQAISHAAVLQEDPQQEMEKSGAHGAMQQPSEEEMAAMMEEWMKLTQPSGNHELLEKSVGEWDSTTELFWGGPGSQPIVTTGKSTRKLVLGGRFILQEENTTMMMPDPAGGEPQPAPWNGSGAIVPDPFQYQLDKRG